MSPAGRFPTGDHLESLRIEVAQDAACGNTRDRVFGATSAVDDGNADAGSHNLERLPPVAANRMGQSGPSA